MHSFARVSLGRGPCAVNSAKGLDTLATSATGYGHARAYGMSLPRMPWSAHRLLLRRRRAVWAVRRQQRGQER
jgi:hypothetical protein